MQCIMMHQHPSSTIFGLASSEEIATQNLLSYLSSLHPLGGLVAIAFTHWVFCRRPRRIFMHGGECRKRLLFIVGPS